MARLEAFKGECENIYASVSKYKMEKTIRYILMFF